ncbi:MAG: Spy/CpxP family protein refolding chaperone [Acidobacteriota bacterium]|nr:Spy/CpxP family protein refolding chaperone [Acidobacteriota bacterium]
MKQNLQISILLAALLLVVSVSSAPAQAVRPGQPEHPPSEPQHRQFGGDPIRQLNLTPEQREQIRTIREQSKEERDRINERLRETNRALEAALDSDNPVEAAVEERVREVMAAQAAAMRLRVLTEVKIRRVLTVEQKTLLRTLREQAQEHRRERQIDRSDLRDRRRHQRTLRMQNRRDGVGPLAPRPDLQQKP